MSGNTTDNSAPSSNTKTNTLGLKTLYLKEDAWATWIGLAVIAFGLLLWNFGFDLRMLMVSFAPYDNFYEVPALVAPVVPNILVLYAVLLLVFGTAMRVMGFDLGDFVQGFTLLFVIALIVQILGAWRVSTALSLETPLIALLLGMIVGNFVRIPSWFDNAMRTEFYVKTGIVFMGATLPFSLILQAGPLALGQALIISVVTFAVIYGVATRVFKLDKPFAATLGVGGSVCGISASIAVASSVNAKKSHVSMAISLVVIWAIIMVFILPLTCRALGLEGGVVGAWIGSSEFADAAGMVAAAQFGDEAITTFTLVKVLGRDVFIGIWAFVLAVVRVARWERGSEQGASAAQRPSAKVIWERFPKFVLGFIAASVIISIVNLGLGTNAAALLNNAVVDPIKGLRDWAFVLCFLCIGMTTRFSDLASTGWKPIVAFSVGVAVNFVLGFLLSSVFLADYWMSVGT